VRISNVSYRPTLHPMVKHDWCEAQETSHASVFLYEEGNVIVINSLESNYKYLEVCCDALSYTVNVSSTLHDVESFVLRVSRPVQLTSHNVGESKELASCAAVGYVLAAVRYLAREHILGFDTLRTLL
jgi:hypothetical protein